MFGIIRPIERDKNVKKLQVISKMCHPERSEGSKLPIKGDSSVAKSAPSG